MAARVVRRRKRLKDLLADDLLRENMMKDFSRTMDPEELASHMQELEFRANLPVSEGDMNVSKRMVLEAAITRAELAIWGYEFILFLLGFSQWLGAAVLYSVAHFLDNRQRNKPVGGGRTTTSDGAVSAIEV